MTIDTQQIEQLLAEKRYDEAKKLISEAVSTDLTPAEQGASLTGTAEMYLDILNAVDSHYRDSLAQVIDGLKQIDAAKPEIDDAARIAEVRASLNNPQ